MDPPISGKIGRSLLCFVLPGSESGAHISYVLDPLGSHSFNFFHFLSSARRPALQNSFFNNCNQNSNCNLPILRVFTTNYINTPRGRHKMGWPLGRRGTRHLASRNYPFGITRYWVRRLSAEPGPAHIQEFRLYLPGVDGGTRWVPRLLRGTSVNGFAYAAATPPL